MEEVRIFIVASWKGPAKQDGVAEWIIEYRKPETKEGFIHLEAGTEAQAVLMALINAFHVLDRLVMQNVLEKPCRVKIYTECGNVLNTVQNGWYLQWQENGWENAKGEPVKNAGLWKMFLEKAALHEYTVQTGRHEYTGVMQGDVKRELKKWKRRQETQ